MTLFPAGIEVLKNQRVGPFVDTFSKARNVLHDKLAEICDPVAIFAIPREHLFEQVSLVIDEMLDFERFELSSREREILGRVLALDLMESQNRHALVSRAIN